jgi:hypothetical protein
VHGIVSCGRRRAVEVVALRSVLSPVCCLCVMLIFGLRGEELKIMVMQGALPQAGAALSQPVLCVSAAGSLPAISGPHAMPRDAPTSNSVLFVVFKEFKIQPDVFSTSTTLGTALCLPVMSIWCVCVRMCVRSVNDCKLTHHSVEQVLHPFVAILTAPLRALAAVRALAVRGVCVPRTRATYIFV